MDPRCLDEVQQLHVFFQDWFNGRIENTTDCFERVAGVLAPDFVIDSPDRQVSDRTQVLAKLREAWGVYRETPIVIEVKNCNGRPLDDGHHVATYEEWQEREGRRRGWLSTAVLRRGPGTPNGLVWVHLVEVWLPATEAD